MSYTCSFCKETMQDVLKPEPNGFCVYCHFNQKLSTNSVPRGYKISKKMCNICGSFKEIVTFNKKYCYHCKTGRD